MDRESIISEIKRTAKDNGNKPLGKERFRKETGILPRDWLGKYWARWGDALEEAGFSRLKLQEKFPDDKLLDVLIKYIRELGRFPTNSELKLKASQDKGFPSATCFTNRWKQQELLNALLDHCNSVGDHNDVISIIEPLVKSGPINKTRTSQKKTVKEVIGYVYLIKSGKYYKIGLTKDPNRRTYDLKIQLPDPPKLIHTIRTDDPVGIEAYWHNRFKDRHKNGEWFELTKEDVTDFKRRTYQ